MLNKKWSSLDDERKTGRLKRGHFGEYFAGMQFMLYGFEVYKSLVDDRGIDFVIKNQNGVYFDIQVKSRTGDGNIVITRGKFATNNPRLYLVAIRYLDDEEPEMYIIPSAKWAEPNTVFYDSGKANKKPQYGLRLYEKNCGSGCPLEEFKFETYIKHIKAIEEKSILIKSKPFGFDIINELDFRAIQRILLYVSKTDLARVFKDIDSVTKEILLNNMSKRAAILLQEDVEVLGPITPDEIKEAKDKIVELIISLENKGEIVIRRVVE